MKKYLLCIFSLLFAIVIFSSGHAAGFEFFRDYEQHAKNVLTHADNTVKDSALENFIGEPNLKKVYRDFFLARKENAKGLLKGSVKVNAQEEFEHFHTCLMNRMMLFYGEVSSKYTAVAYYILGHAYAIELRNMLRGIWPSKIYSDFSIVCKDCQQMNLIGVLKRIGEVDESTDIKNTKNAILTVSQKLSETILKQLDTKQ